MSHSNQQIEEIVLNQLERQLEGFGLDPRQASAISAARKVLHEEELSPEEQEVLEAQALDDAADPVSLVIARRIERAVRAGCEAAGVAPEKLQLTEVLVLRSGESAQFSGLLAKVMAHISECKQGGSGHMLVVAAQNLFKKLKQVLPTDRIAGLPSVEFSEDGPIERHDTAPLEVVSADLSLDQLEKRATATLTSIRKDSLDSDAMMAAWVAGSESESSGDSVMKLASTDPEGADDPMIGQLFHLKYRIVKRIGKGGFGSVYEAEDERGAGNRVAIKILSGSAAESAAQQQSFKDEARRVTRISHPNIVDWKVFDETEDGIPYFVMELVKGEEFEETLRRDRKVDPTRAAKLLLQVLDALRAAHHLSKNESVLHLDLKPQNLFRIPPKQGREEQLKVLDFGIGQYIGDEVVEDDTVVPVEGLDLADLDGPSTLTFARPGGAGKTAGGVKRSKGCTPEYASPEQSAHVLYEEDILPLDGRSDLYSLGVVAFEMLTGQLPFKAKSRLDVLKMHRSDPAPQVGSMGVRIPSKLAKFVDRCLQKDREKRWKDTNEAYRFLHEIVHPPVWKAVAKVTVPIVLVGVGLGSWIWMNREVVVPTASVATSSGIDLANTPLYLGPETTSAEIALTARNGSLPGDTSGTWSVVRAADSTPLDGWSASWSSPGIVSLMAPADLSGRVEERVELHLGEQLHSDPINLIWIGAGTWEVSALRVGERNLDELQGMGIDPFGSSLDVWISGDARADLAEVSVQIGDSDPLELTMGASSGERSRYRLDFADAGIAAGSNELHWRVRDGAGMNWSRSISLEVVLDEPRLAKLAIVDAAGERQAGKGWPEATKILDSYMITPRTVPNLRVELSRPADVTWKVLIEGSAEAQMVGESQGKRTFDFDLTGLGDLQGGDPYRGRIEVVVNEDRYVLHAEGSGRGAIAQTIPFSVEDTMPTFVSQWRTPTSAHRLDSAADQTLFTNTAKGELLVIRQAPLPMGVEVAWWPNHDTEEIRTQRTELLHNPQVQQAALPVEFDADGEWTVRVRSFRYDTAAQTTGDRADIEETFNLVLDRMAPTSTVAGLASGQVLDATDAGPQEVTVSFDGVDSGAREAAVDLDWQVVRIDPFAAFASGSVQNHDPSSGEARIDIGATLEKESADLLDGDYRLDVSGKDSAGNPLKSSSVEFIVARHGPEVRLDEPSGFGKWRRDAATGRWQVRAQAVDPNGVLATTCRLLTGENEIPIDLQTESGSSAVQRSLIGSIVLPYTLSEAKVRLAFDASDEHGAESSWTSEEFELPVIVRPSPEAVVVRLEENPIEAMRLVRGNQEFQYLFGGRGDEVENPDFIAAGLGSFNEHPRRSRSRSWQVPFAAGSIEDYYLDEHEVSVGQYLAFLNHPNGYSAATHWPDERKPDEDRREALITELEARDQELPVVGVTWAEASAYASWVGKRLPSWLEWEYAVRGGAEYRPFDSYSDVVEAVEAIASTREEPGAFMKRGSAWTHDSRFADLCGNVAEWTSTGFGTGLGVDRYPHQWALEDPTRLQSTSVNGNHFWVVGGQRTHKRIDFSVADYREVSYCDESIGFRCAISLSELQDQLGHHLEHGPNFEERL